MKQINRKERGFTLVELLIVVAIIGILAAIAIPQFTQYKADAVSAQASANITNCASEAAAKFATSSDSNGTVDCNIGEGYNSTVSVDVNGSLSIGNGTGEISGYNVTCSVDGNNKITCSTD